MTLGWILPWRATKLQSLLSNDMRFGNRPFRFTARSGPLYGPFAVALDRQRALLFSAITGIVGALRTHRQRCQLAAGVPEPGQSTPSSILPRSRLIVSRSCVVFYILFGHH